MHAAAVLTTAGPPGVDVVLASMALAGALTYGFWALFGAAVTLAHEGGHALVSLLFGGKVLGIAVNPDRTGLTSYLARTSLAPFVSALAGYTGPPLFGLGGAALLSRGYADAVLVGSLVLVVLSLFVLTNWFARGMVVVLAVVLFVVARADSLDFRQFAATTWVWLLLAGGLTQVLEHGRHASDAHALKKMTYIPTIVWAVVYGTVAVFSILVSALLLLGIVDPPF